MQAIFSAVFYFSSVSLYQGFLMVGYATIYTMLPVFALVLDTDVTGFLLHPFGQLDIIVDFSGKTAITYPELYKELTKGRSLSYKTFFIWVLISIYQVTPQEQSRVQFNLLNVPGWCHHVWSPPAL